jgi:anionic cell wall polymer biosynthesis LytR-Cps2A-Psr (LCP) family protein
VIVNLDGFRDLVDAMGGVEINVRERVPLGGETWTDANGNSYLVEGTENGWLEIGPKKLNGYQALWYSRSRITSDDFSRMRRQRCVVAALVNQVNPMTMVQRYPQIAEVAGDNIAVSIDQEELPAWADLVLRVQKGTIRSLPFTNENIDTVNPDYTAIHATVLQAISPPPPEPSPSAGEGAEATQDPASETTEAPEPSAPDEATGTAPEEPSDELTDVAAVC